jgi:hypothetical protein
MADPTSNANAPPCKSVGAHPPKSKLAVRIGVTGHRPKDLRDADLDLLQRQVRNVVQVVREASERVIASEPSSYLGTSVVLRIISPLAEGADRIVAEVAMAEGCELQAPLPFARDEYEKDFPASVGEFRTLLKLATSVFELDGSRDNHERENESYENVGQMILRHSDVIIAIWNGKAAENVGGTGQIIEEALRLGIPTVCIHSGTPHQVTLRVRTENSENDGTSLSHLSKRLVEVLAPPRSDKPPSWWHRVIQLFAPSSHVARDLRETYFSETQRRFNYGFPFEMFAALAERFWPNWPVLWLPTIPQKALDSPDRTSFTRNFLKMHHDWADSLANFYVNLYRSSFVVNYVLAALAVSFALCNFILKEPKPWPTWVELGLILMIIIITIMGNHWNWHRKWVDYRLLAEYFRTSLFLAPLGWTLPSVRPRPLYERDDPGNTWVSWHFRAVMREAGLPFARADAQYLQKCLKDVNADIQHQVDYHDRNRKELSRIYKHLHLGSLALFGLTLLACILHLTLENSWATERLTSLNLTAHAHWVSNFLTVLAAALPTFGAAIAGILSQGEFHRNADHSEAMQQRLNQIASAAIHPETTSVLKAIGQLAEEAAEVMVFELLDWRSIFQVKVLGLPA